MSVSSSNLEVDNYASQALQYLSEKKFSELRTLLESLHPVELVSVINAVSEELQPELIHQVTGLDQIAGLISYASEALKQQTLELLDDSRIAAVVRRLEVDDAADIMKILPRRKQVSILKRLSPQKVKEITTLLSYDEETAGGIMTTLFLSLPGDLVAEEALRQLRTKLQVGEINPDVNISYIYITSTSGELLGVCSLRELLIARPDNMLSSIMSTPVMSVSPEDDQEKVAKLIADYDFAALPVVTEEDRKLLGIVTVDDVLDVIEDERTEDLLKLAGTVDEDIVSTSIPTAIRSRLPWLLASWLGGVGGALLLGGYSETLTHVVTLAFFMPVVFGMAGNVGSQSSTITVCALATGTINHQGTLRRLRREAFTGMLLGVIFGVLLGSVSYALHGEPKLSFVVSFSIFITMTCAASFGSMLPMIIRFLGFDPTVASGPFVTTATDILSILIYFTVASILL